MQKQCWAELVLPTRLAICTVYNSSMLYYYSGSMEIRASTYISTKKGTYTYESLQVPVEMNTRGSKTLTTFNSFHTKYDLQSQSLD